MKKLIVLLLVLTMMLTLTGCKKDDYESAVALMDAGSYAEAIVAFTELGDYEDSAQRLEECKNITTYAEATALFEAENYEEALKLFTALGNYEDSAEKCVECQNAITYNEAVALFEEGAYFEAKAVFETIPDYRDVAEYLARYQTVELNAENWQEYFELVLVEDWRKNDFDEVSDLWIGYRLQAKEVYSNRISEFEGQEIKIAYTFDYAPHYGSCDFESMTYSVGSELGVEYGSARDHIDRTMAFSVSDICAGIDLCSNPAPVRDEQGEVNGMLVPVDFEIPRIEGIIWCVAE